MFNYTKSSKFKQNRNQSEFFVGSLNPYLTRTNNSHSDPCKSPLEIEQESRELAHKLETSKPIFFNEQIRRGWVRIKYLNQNEFSVYRVPNKVGNTHDSFKSVGVSSFSTNARFSARNRLIETIKANPDFSYFFTGTFNPKKYDRKNFKVLQKSLTTFLRKRKIKYILIPEPHKDGSIHFHGLFNESIKPYLAEFDTSKKLPTKITDAIKENKQIFNFPDYAKQFGWVSIEQIRDFNACAVYVSKYVTKSFDSDSRFSYRRYFCSIGLNKPKFIQTPKISYSDFNKHYSTYIPKVIYRRSAERVARPLATATPFAPDSPNAPPLPI